jgi:hypothetical protein
MQQYINESFAYKFASVYRVEEQTAEQFLAGRREDT